MPTMRVPLSWLNDFLCEELDPRRAADLLGDAGLSVWSVERPGVLDPRVVAARVERQLTSTELVVSLPTPERVYLPPRAGPAPAGGSMLAVALSGTRLYASGSSPGARRAGVLFRLDRLPGGPEVVGRVCSPAELGLGAQKTAQLLHPGAVEGAPVARFLPRGWAEEILNVDVPESLAHCHSVIGLAQEIASRLGQPTRCDHDRTAGAETGDAAAGIGAADRGLLRLAVSAEGWSAAMMAVQSDGISLRDVEWRRGAYAGLTAESAIDRALEIAAYEFGVRLAAYSVPANGVVRVSVHQFGAGTQPSDQPLGFSGLGVSIDPPPYDAAAGDGRTLVLAIAPGDLSGDARCLPSVQRACALLSGGRAGKPADQAVSADGPRRPVRSVPLNLDALCATTGLDLSLDDCGRLLHRIGASIGESGAVRSPDQGGCDKQPRADRLRLAARPEPPNPGARTCRVAIPSSRTDLVTTEDLVAELVRLCGYGRLPITTPIPFVRPAQDRDRRRLHAVREALGARGVQEVVTPMVVELPTMLPDQDGEARRHPPIPLLSPGRDARTMGVRRSLIPGLVATAAAQPPGLRACTLMELGRVVPGPGPGPGPGPSKPAEVDLLAVVRASPLRAEGGAEEGWEVDCRTVYDAIRTAVRALGLAGFHAEPSEESMFHIGTGMRLMISGRKVGRLGLLSPTPPHARGPVPLRYVVAEIEVDALLDIEEEPVKANAPSRFPAVMVDVNLVTAEAVYSADVLDAFRSASALVRAADVVDVYHDASAGAVRRLTIRVTLGSPWRTLGKGEALAAVKLGLLAAAQVGARPR